MKVPRPVVALPWSVLMAMMALNLLFLLMMFLMLDSRLCDLEVLWTHPVAGLSLVGLLRLSLVLLTAYLVLDIFSESRGPARLRVAWLHLALGWLLVWGSWMLLSRIEQWSVAWGADARVPQLVRKLEAGDAEARGDAAWELARYRDRARRAVPALTTRLRDDDPRVRARAARALGEIGLTRGTRPLVEELLLDPDDGVQRAARRALATPATR